MTSTKLPAVSPIINFKISPHRFRKLVLDWYRHNRRDLPWRKTSDAYRIWISEIMLQQTQVTTVIPYYRLFIRRFPTVRRLAAADPEDVLSVWQGLGYYRRAIHLHEAAGIITKKYNGIIPSTYDELSALPGFGEYTTGAVLSIAFNQRLPAIDGNVVRIFSRLIADEGNCSQNTIKSYVRELLTTLVPEDQASDFNQSLMDLGAMICTPKRPNCALCPLRKICRAFKHSDPEQFPIKKGTKKRDVRPVSVAVIYHRGRFLISKRPPGGLLPNLWEFPGGKIFNGESPEDACVREAHEETGLRIKVLNLIARFTHHYSHFSVDLHFFKCSCNTKSSLIVNKIQSRWVRQNDLRQFPFPRSTQRVIEKLNDFFP